MIEEFLDAGSQIDPRDEDGKTPLHLACASENVLAVIALLRRGAATEVTDRFGATPILRAIANGREEAVKAPFG
jgi:ankyrin repeat protein